MTMRLKKVKARNGQSTYSRITDDTKLNGKRTSTTYELLGDDEKLKDRFGSENTMDKVKEYIDSLNKMLKENKELPVNLTLDPNKQI